MAKTKKRKPKAQRKADAAVNVARSASNAQGALSRGEERARRKTARLLAQQEA
jgi:ABC-type hemin transport system ATPase subunit